MQSDENKLDRFMARMVGEVGAVVAAPLVALGHRLGLYKVMAGQGPMTSEAVARRAGFAERYVRDWLVAQVASGFIQYDSVARTFELENEVAMCFADKSSPTFLADLFDTVEATYRNFSKLELAFRSGLGVTWHERHASMFRVAERLFRAGQTEHLVSEWLPALEGVDAKLRAEGARVADVGCGDGVSTILMAQAYPLTTFVGFDCHESSVEIARANAQKAGVADRVKFEVSTEKQYSGDGYDLVAVFDFQPGTGAPICTAAHVAKTLKPNGTWMIVEPCANDAPEDNLNPAGRIYYSAFALIRTPALTTHEGQMALDAHAGEARLRDVAMQGGFTRFRRAHETPFNLVFEARL